jgi:cell wall-associated NlpC family hydrolase
VLQAVLASCGSQHSRDTDERNAQPENPKCPARSRAPATLPNTPAELSSVAYWESAFTPAQLDQVLMREDELSAHDEALRGPIDDTLRFVDLSHVPDGKELEHEMNQRLDFWRARFRSREYVLENAGDKNPERAFDAHFIEERSLRVALSPIALRCTPMLDVVRSVKGDKRFDRNMCSQVRAQEAIEVMGRYGDVLFARGRFAVGFIDPKAPLSPPVPAELEAAYRSGRELTLQKDLKLLDSELPARSALVANGEGGAWLATAKGFEKSRPLTAQEAAKASRPLTRRAFLREAFSYLGSPYGLGDEKGGRDCSRFILDVLRSFGLHLPRTSVQQSKSGLYTIDIPPETNETERLGLLDEAVQRGVVLMHFPGHIAIYLGRDKAGVPRLLHSFAEYLAPCEGGGETLFEVERVSVSDLSLGKNTSRRAFLERMTRLTVFGKPPGQGLLAVSTFRTPVSPHELKPRQCRDDGSVALFASPREPSTNQSLRVIAVSDNDARPAGLWLVDPAGNLFAPPTHDLGVGPFTRWSEVETPAAGDWTALVADAGRVLACERFRVRAASKGGKSSAQVEARVPDSPAFRVRHGWDSSMEALYAGFVEQLFAHPISDMRSWSSLGELVQNPERNLLFNYLGQNEDTQLKITPDCADLPYFLRALFAFKLGLPFGFRHCSRGHQGAPPHCTEVVRNDIPIAASDDVSAFDTFLRKHVGQGVHSASGRTLPDDEQSDLYPLPLTREALRPGSVFVDPYGHLIVVAQWVPQGFRGQGMLLGADAQPDASIGRRRFWRGNFLFTPDTHDVGAGFKAFRPLPEPVHAERNVPDYRREGSFPPSLEQYKGSQDDFYAKMDALIYPRPVAVMDRMMQLVDALDEQLRRRVEAIDLGEGHMREHPQVMAMPNGYTIFETEGAWEDFATPSRDMRLLIAIDTLRDFPNEVKRAPERFLASQAQVDAVPAQLEQALNKRSFSYTRSDGSPQELTLAAAVARASAIEVGYNPNDCVEKRWGAEPGSDEYATCKRHAPKAQQEAMERYRSWFHTRTRPARP